jgi:hypothetical protein
MRKPLGASVCVKQYLGPLGLFGQCLTALSYSWSAGPVRRNVAATFATSCPDRPGPDRSVASRAAGLGDHTDPATGAPRPAHAEFLADRARAGGDRHRDAQHCHDERDHEDGQGDLPSRYRESDQEAGHAEEQDAERPHLALLQAHEHQEDVGGEADAQDEQADVPAVEDGHEHRGQRVQRAESGQNDSLDHGFP